MGRPRLDSGQQEGEEEVVKLKASSACPGELQVRRIDGGGGGTTEGTQRNRGWASFREKGDERDGEKEGSRWAPSVWSWTSKGAGGATTACAAWRHGANAHVSTVEEREEEIFPENPLQHLI